VAKDIAKAREWFAKAASLGDKPGAEELARLEANRA